MIEYVSQSRTEAPSTNGHSDSIGASRYLDYLPAIYRDDDFMGRFLLIFESVLGPIESTVGNLPLYFDPRLAPEAVLPWLASWVGIALDPALPVARRRELVARAAELYRWRGTRRGLSEYLRICTGVVPEISEHIAGMRLDPETKLGDGTRLGRLGGGPLFRCDDAGARPGEARREGRAGDHRCPETGAHGVHATDCERLAGCC